MTKILDASDTIKTEEMGLNWRNKLWNDWQLNRPFKEVSPEIISVITKKCRGNPYLVLDYFRQMLHTGYIEINKRGLVIPTESFLRCQKYNDWTPLVTP